MEIPSVDTSLFKMTTLENFKTKLPNYQELRICSTQISKRKFFPIIYILSCLNLSNESPFIWCKLPLELIRYLEECSGVNRAYAFEMSILSWTLFGQKLSGPQMLHHHCGGHVMFDVEGEIAYNLIFVRTNRHLQIRSIEDYYNVFTWSVCFQRRLLCRGLYNHILRVSANLLMDQAQGETHRTKEFLIVHDKNTMTYEYDGIYCGTFPAIVRYSQGYDERAYIELAFAYKIFNDTKKKMETLAKLAVV